MPSYSVLAVEKIKDGQGTKGPFTVWKLGLRNGDGNEEAIVAELFCPAGVQPPAEGATVEGHIEKTTNPSWLDKFKPANRGGGGGFKPRDPAERRSIAMQHAQKCAVTILSVAAEHGEYKPPNASEVVGQVKVIAQALFDQVAQAEAGA